MIRSKPDKLIGAAKGTVRYDLISRARLPKNLRFWFWSFGPGTFRVKLTLRAAFSNPLRPKIADSAPFGKFRGQSNQESSRGEVHPQFRFYPFHEKKGVITSDPGALIRSYGRIAASLL